MRLINFLIILEGINLVKNIVFFSILKVDGSIFEVCDLFFIFNKFDSLFVWLNNWI